MALNFLKRKYFPEIRVFKIKVVTFYAAFLMQRSLEVNPGCMTSVPPNSPLIKWREVYRCLILGLNISFSPLEIFLPTPLLKNEKVEGCKLVTERVLLEMMTMLII